MPGTLRRLSPARVVARFGRFEWTLIAIVALGWTIRLVYILAVRQEHFDQFGVVGDAYFYHRGANLLAEGKGFINVFNYDLRHIVQQDAGHPILYILWLWVPSVLGFMGTLPHMLWTSVLGVGTIVLTGLAGREMVGPRTGLIAAFFAAIYPNVWSYDGFLLSESMSIFLATLAVWLAYRYRRAPSLPRALALGGACGLAILGRSELVLLIPLVLIPLALASRTVPFTTRLKWLGAALLMALTLIAPWVVYNNTRFEKPVFITTGYFITLLTASCDDVYYGPNIGYWSMPCAVGPADRIKAWTVDTSVAEEEYRRVAFDYISHHKDRIPAVVLARWARYTGIWDLIHNFDQVHKDIFPEGREPWIAWSSAMMFFVLGPLSIGGALVLRRRHIPVYPVGALIIITFITTTITFYQNRYRASAETAFCLLAAVAVDAGWGQLAARRRSTETAVDSEAEGRPRAIDAEPATADPSVTMSPSGR